MQAAIPPIPLMRRFAPGPPAIQKSVLVAFDPAKISYDMLLKTFWENHDPTQGMAQGNDVGTQYRSAIYAANPSQRTAAEASKAAYAKVLAERGFPVITTEIADRPGVLLRRSLSSAIFGEKPAGLLRPWRHWPCVSHRNCGARLIIAGGRGRRVFAWRGATSAEIAWHPQNIYFKQRILWLK